MELAEVRVEVDGITNWYDQHARSLLRFCARRVGPETAEDVVAATFLTAFERRLDFDPLRSDVLPWLYGIAVNRVPGADPSSPLVPRGSDSSAICADIGATRSAPTGRWPAPA